VLTEAQGGEQRDGQPLRRRDPADPVRQDRQADAVERRRPQEGEPDRQVDELQQADLGEVHAACPQDQRGAAGKEADRRAEGDVQAEERRQRAQARQCGPGPLAQPDGGGSAHRDRVPAHQQRTGGRKDPMRRQFIITLNYWSASSFPISRAAGDVQGGGPAASRRPSRRAAAKPHGQLNAQPEEERSKFFNLE
jgi:hypothetical protein